MISNTLNSPQTSLQTSEEIKLSNYNLKWRQNQLWVTYSEQPQQIALPALKDLNSLVNCLKASPVRLVCLDAALGPKEIQFWADACNQASKPVYLRMSLKPHGFKHQSLKAAIITLALTPIMAIIATLVDTQLLDQILVREWRIGNKGKLFQVWRSRKKIISNNPDVTSLNFYFNRA